MFKTTACILLLSLFIFTQYGRQLAYLQCKVENFYVKTNTASCDCEKNSDNDLTQTEKKLPTQKTHIHLSLDEFYLMNETDHLSFIKDQPVKFSNCSVSFLASFNGNIFHPPQL